uniref:APC membrane recruitment protein 2-like n=1 Tax=Sinocyclocheilus grahami TaxID=75366 RepID=A0A672N9L1_SINGR
MDAQSESCEPPPCDPQPPGKIRKALKLFGKRKPGSSVASIFSIRGKGDGGPKSPPSMSKTLDGLNEPTAPEAEAEPVDLDQEDESQQDDAPMEEFTGGNMNSETTPTRHSISSLTSAKSLSFLNMLRKGRRGLMGERQTQTESQRPGRQRKGLKGLFGTVRWHGKEKKDDEEEGEPGPPLLASRSNSVEIIKESLTLTPGPPPRSVEGTEEKLPTPQEGPTSSEDSAKVSGSTKPPANERLSTLLGDISSILSFDSLTACGDIVADVEAEWVKASSRMEGAPRTLKVDNSEKTSSSSTSTRSKSSPSPTLNTISSSTTAPMIKPIPSSTPIPPSISAPTSETPPSPTIMDDDARIDLREDLVRQEGIDNRDSVATQSISKAVKRGPAAKPTTLSKIPVSGGGRPPKLPHRDSQPNGDEDHSNLPTPVHEEETPFTLSRESSSKEALSDVSTESGAVTPTLSHSQDDILDGKLGLQTSSGPAAGATSLTRESKIPIKHGSTAAYHSVQGRAEATRSKIPVSKMPVRRTSNKPAPTATAAATRK